jgi:hypothetical protein
MWNLLSFSFLFELESLARLRVGMGKAGEIMHDVFMMHKHCRRTNARNPNLGRQ